MPLSQNSYTLILVLFFSLLPLVTHFHNMFAFCCCQYFDWYLVIFIIKLFAIAAYFIYYLCQYYFWPLFFIFYILQYYLPILLTASPNIIGPFFILFYTPSIENPVYQKLWVKTLKGFKIWCMVILVYFAFVISNLFSKFRSLPILFYWLFV